MAILQKKICMIGDFSVGKTSLVSRFVRQTFSDKYLTTVGVKIDTKLVKLSDELEVKLILWDIAGNDALTTAASSYLRGAAGFLLVVDGTRLPTWHSALNLKDAIAKQLGEKPFVMLLNKIDLTEQWELNEQILEEKTQQGWKLLSTSAKTGMNVEKAFLELAIQILK
ncbi:Rab family GTPase [Candidatus Parabeggiatoa sp. HSG14]|uniref:Rab family GTPase n=1 Tax=Candidatus Parabeggiatoa sp. HSG14 TaxID=3055593 RepID=UPI0025A72882|nr:Rab family GTPase [Thiotrichales bacterium HSG14]